MKTTENTLNRDLTGPSLDLANVDVEKALQHGRNLRAQAFSSMFRNLFGGVRREKQDHRQHLSPDCAAHA